jgi:uncharacterized membrane protein
VTQARQADEERHQAQAATVCVRKPGVEGKAAGAIIAREIREGLSNVNVQAILPLSAVIDYHRAKQGGFMRAIPELGRWVYGAAAVALGVLAMAWGDFPPIWHPLPDPPAVAYPAAILFVLGGTALPSRRTGRLAALLLAALYLIFIVGWISRVVAAPDEFNRWLGVSEQLAVMLGAIACWVLADGGRSPGSERIALACRILFGLCCFGFGAAHFLFSRETAAFVPDWLPPSQIFWAYATGVADILAGLALVSGVLALLAARLLTAMFVGFGLHVWLPALSVPSDPLFAWGGNVANLTLVAAAWAVADLIARRPAPAVG